MGTDFRQPCRPTYLPTYLSYLPVHSSPIAQAGKSKGKGKGTGTGNALHGHQLAVICDRLHDRLVAGRQEKQCHVHARPTAGPVENMCQGALTAPGTAQVRYLAVVLSPELVSSQANHATMPLTQLNSWEPHLFLLLLSLSLFSA